MQPHYSQSSRENATDGEVLTSYLPHGHAYREKWYLWGPVKHSFRTMMFFKRSCILVATLS